MNLTKTQQGDLYIISSIVLWSLFPILTIISLKSITPILSLAIITIIAAIFFALVLLSKKRKLFYVPQKIRASMIATIAINGIFYYVLMFLALQFTTAGNASIISLMEICFSFLVLSMWGKEKLIPSHIFGAGLMIIGALFVLFQGTFTPNAGDILILIAAFSLPFGNYYAKEVRKELSSMEILFIRNAISGPFLLLLALLFEHNTTINPLLSSLPILIFIGIFLLGISKVFWLEGIHRIPISKAVSFFPLGPLCTLFFAFLILSETPTTWQLLGLLPIIGGIFFLTDIGKKV